MKRVLLDENLPRGLADALQDLGINAEAFPNSWKGLTNGKLLAQLDSSDFDVLVTADASMAYQQTLRGRRFGVVSLPTNKRGLLVQRAQDIAGTIELARPGSWLVVTANGRRVLVTASTDAMGELTLLPIQPFR